MPEHFTDDVEATLDPAETGRVGCLEPQIEDDGEHGEEDDDE
jgi:hypothetical protein